MFGRVDDGSKCHSEPHRRSPRFPFSFSWSLTVFVFTALLCQRTNAQVEVCDPGCQARQATALARFQAGLLAPGQSPDLLNLYPGVAAAIAAGIVVPNEGAHAASLAAALAAAAVPVNNSTSLGPSSDMPAHCSALGAQNMACTLHMTCCLESIIMCYIYAASMYVLMVG